MGHSPGVLRLIGRLQCLQFSACVSAARQSENRVVQFLWIRKFPRMRQAGNYSVVQENSGARNYPHWKSRLVAGGGEFQCSVIILFWHAQRREKKACQSSSERYSWDKESSKEIFWSCMVLDPSHCCSLEILDAFIGKRKES
jgi:hypothetical protein